MAGEPLRFGRPKKEDTPRGTNRLVIGLLGACIGLALVRPWFSPSMPDGVPIEVRGEVPRPGLHLVTEPTVARAIAAAGGTSDDPRPLSLGDRVEVTAGAVRVLPASDPLLVGLPIDLNTAEAEALAAVPGVGSSIAARIVDDRSTRGPFRRLDDLNRVSGVGPHTVELLGPFVTLGSVPPVNLDTASAAELETLPGIGPVLAARIVVDRADHGPFRSVDDLRRVDGISQALVDALAAQVTVGP